MSAGPDPTFPRPFGDYLLFSSFGRGGMGEVFLAQREGLGAQRLCVVKTLRGELADDEEYIRRFLDEARVVTQLTHSGLTHVFDAGQVNDTYYMAMEYIRGVNLRDLLNEVVTRGVRLAPGLALYIVSNMLDALEYAHTLGHPMTGEPLHLVHRDVSPHNAMVSFEGEVKVIDFGLAQSVLKREETASQVVLGKVAYMSPEHARGEDVDATADQFAVGVVAYELLTGLRFYDEMKQHEIWQVVGRGGYKPQGLSQIDGAMADIMRRSWAATPSERWPSCERMRDAIDDVRAERHPGVGKKQLRALMQEIFAARITDERSRLSALAEVTGPEQQRTMSNPSGVRAFPNAQGEATADDGGTASPDATMTVSASGTVSRLEQDFAANQAGAADRPDTVRLVRGDALAVEPVRPPSKPRTPLALGAATAALIVIAVVATLYRTDPPSAERVAPPPAPVEPAPREAPLVKPAPPEPNAPEPEAAAEPAEAPKPPAKQKYPAKGKRRAQKTASRKPAATTKTEPVTGAATAKTDPPAAPAEEPKPAPVPPKAFTFDDDWAEIQTCSRKCAKSIRELFGEKALKKLRKNPTVVRNCAAGCRGGR